MRRRAVAGAAGLLLVGTLSIVGCTPGADASASPSASGFASEEEAFAAAEATYRAYVDALNRVDLSDTATFEDVYAWTTGDALDGEKKSLTGMHAEGWRLGGSSEVVSVTTDLEHSAISSGHAVLHACTDISSVTVTDAGGASVVSEDRPDVQSIVVELEADTTADRGWLVSDLSGGAHQC